MPLDPSILIPNTALLQQIANPPTVQDYQKQQLALQNARLQSQVNQQQLQTGALELQEKQRAVQQQQEVIQAFHDSGGDMNKAVQALYAKGNPQAFTLQQNANALQKSLDEHGKALDEHKKGLTTAAGNFAAGVLDIKDPAARGVAYQSAKNTLEMMYPELKGKLPPEYTPDLDPQLQSMADLPQTAKERAETTAAQALTQQRGTETAAKQRTDALSTLSTATSPEDFQQKVQGLKALGVPDSVLQEFSNQTWTPALGQQLQSQALTPEQRGQAPKLAAETEAAQVKNLGPQLAQSAARGTYAQDYQNVPPNLQKYFPDPATNPKDLDVLRAAMTPAEQRTAAYQQQEVGLRRQQLGLEGARLGVERLNAGLDPKTGQPIQYMDPQGQPTNVSPVAAAIAAYRLPPVQARSLASAQGRNLMNQVLAANKDFDIGQYEERYKTMQDLRPGGKMGQQILPINTLVRHSDDMFDAVEALNNGDFTALNAAKQKIAQWTGSAVPTNFDQLKQFVVGETVKAIRGNGGAEKDAEEARAPLDRANSPAQLLGAMKTNFAVLGGKMQAINQAVRPAIGDPNFNALDPGAKQILEKRGYDPETLKPVAKGAAGMVTLRAPDGKTQAVPADQVAHYLKLGATRVQ